MGVPKEFRGGPEEVQKGVQEVIMIEGPRFVATLKRIGIFASESMVMCLL